MTVSPRNLDNNNMWGKVRDEWTDVHHVKLIYAHRNVCQRKLDKRPAEQYNLQQRTGDDNKRKVVHF